MRMGAELESLMTKWHDDLYSEFSAICIAMQVGPDSGARDSWNDYLERYVEWNYALPHQLSPFVIQFSTLSVRSTSGKQVDRRSPGCSGSGLIRRGLKPLMCPRNW